jgi:hypothetical protein
LQRGEKRERKKEMEESLYGFYCGLLQKGTKIVILHNGDLGLLIDDYSWCITGGVLQGV